MADQQAASVSRRRALLLLDVDHVFSRPDLPGARYRALGEEVSPPQQTPYGAPAPGALVTLRAIARCRRVKPLWLSAWSEAASVWETLAGLEPAWGQAWPSSGRWRTKAERSVALVRADGGRLDTKLLAVAYLLRHDPTVPVVWLEDGFATETVTWAKGRGRVRLVDPGHRPTVPACLVNGRPHQGPPCPLTRADATEESATAWLESLLGRWDAHEEWAA